MDVPEEARKTPLADITSAFLKNTCSVGKSPLILKVLKKPDHDRTNLIQSVKTVRFVGKTSSSQNASGPNSQPRQDTDLLQTRKLFKELGESVVVLPPVVSTKPTIDNARVCRPNVESISITHQNGAVPDMEPEGLSEDENNRDLSDDEFMPKKKNKTRHTENFSPTDQRCCSRKTPNCRKSAAQIAEAINKHENESKSHPLFSKYHDLLPTTFNYVFTSLEEKAATQKNSDSFRAVLRLSIFNREEADMWVQEFEDLSMCDYRVRDCKKENSSRLVAKRIFRCQHNIPKVKEKVQEQVSKEVNKIKRRSKDTSCMASLRITIKQNMAWSSDDLIEKYPCEIIISHSHNHPIIAKEALRFRRPIKTVEEKFKTLFGQGHSPSSAVEIHKFDLQDELGDGYVVAAADRSKCPDVKWASRLYYKIFRKVYGEPHGDQMVEALEDFISKYNESRGSKCAAMQKLNEKDLIAAICTPMMKRIHERLRSAGEIMFVDSSGTMDVLNTRVFVLLCPSIAGALPLGLLLVSSEAEVVIKAALDLWVSLLPDSDKSFGGRGKQGPKIIMTDDSSAERNALHSVFPDAVLLLCIFHVLQAYWRYVWKSEHKVEKNDRSDVHFGFREVLYCLDAEVFERLWNEMFDLPAVKSNPHLVKHLNDLKPRVAEWALHMRQDLLLRGHNTNNYAEAVMRILKDLICHRTKAFSPVQLLDFLVTRYNSYLERRIVDVINNRVVNSHRSRYFISPLKIVPLKCYPLSRAHTYLVKNESKGTEYFVNMLDEVCSCPQGRNGAPCEHQCAVVRDFNVPSTQVQNFAHHEDPKLKEDLFYIVYGSTAQLPQDWFTPLIPFAAQQENSADPDLNAGFESNPDINASGESNPERSTLSSASHPHEAGPQGTQ